MSYRLGVDVGGTFTDLLMINEANGQTFRTKVPSTPHDPSEAVVAGSRQIAEIAGVEAHEIERFFHGTTVATNAVLEGKGARVGLVVTEGYRQILQIARSFVPGGLAGWIVWPKPEPLAALECTIECPGRMAANGTEVRPLDEAVLRERLETLKAEKIEAVTVCLINSYLNEDHERRVGEICAEVFPDLPITLSVDILPEMQEYERALTTVANSMVRPPVARYVGHLEKALKDWGTPARLNLLRSDGGLMSGQKSQEAPVNLLMSGPAGGVAGALYFARQAGFENVLTLDMGGTSTDVALIEKATPRLRRETSVGNLTVRASSLDIKTVGAGGGSIAHVPELTGALRVGPESAGAVPGPVAYGRGGEVATVTDANVVLGYLPESLLGGRMELDRDGAKKAVQKVADALGVRVMEAAAGIIDIVNEHMFGALRLVSVQQGYDPRDFALMGFGGAGPLHANALGKLMQSWPVIIPPSPGVLCAYGDATTAARVEAQRSFNKTTAQTSDRELADLMRELEAVVVGDLQEEGLTREEITVSFEMDIRYLGQAFEVPLEVRFTDFDEEAGLCALTRSFDDEHERLFTFTMHSPHEVVNVRATAIGAPANVAAETIPEGNGDPSAAKIRDHRLYMDGAMRDAAIYDRGKLKSGDVVQGPAVISEMDSTTLILGDHKADIDRFGNILITPV